MWNQEPNNPPGKNYGYGLAWLAGDVWQNYGAYAHEMGHNYWLAVRACIQAAIKATSQPLARC
jgi:hypothetical protein